MFSKEEKLFIRRLRERPEQLEEGDPTFERVLREIANGKSIDQMGLVSFSVTHSLNAASTMVIKRR